MGRALPLKGPPPTTCTGAQPTFIYDTLYMIYDTFYMIYDISFISLNDLLMHGAGCMGDLADSEIQVVVELCRNRYKMHLKEFMLNISTSKLTY